MEAVEIKKPLLSKPLTFSYSVSDEEYDRTRRRLERADEIGLKLFVLDNEESSKELQELENFIIDNYIDMDIDIPDDLKKQYVELKKANSEQ